MWKTRDGHILRLPPSGLATLLPQLRQPAVWDLVRQNLGEGLAQAAARALGQLANRACRVGSLRQRDSTAGYRVFGVQLGGRYYHLVARPLDSRHSALVAIRPVADQLESEIEYQVGDPAPKANNGQTGNIHHWAWIRKIAAAMRARKWSDVRVDQQQVARGRVAGTNKPDVQGRDRSGRRVNVEVDTDAGASARHQNQVIAANPDSRSIFILIHPRTGQVIERRIYDPRTKQVAVRSGPMPQQQGRLILGETPFPQVMP